MLTIEALTYDQRLESIRRTKLEHTIEKQKLGPRNSDDHGPKPCEYWVDCGPTDFDNPAPAITIMAAQDL